MMYTVYRDSGEYSAFRHAQVEADSALQAAEIAARLWDSYAVTVYVHKGLAERFSIDVEETYKASAF